MTLRLRLLITFLLLTLTACRTAPPLTLPGPPVDLSAIVIEPDATDSPGLAAAATRTDGPDYFLLSRNGRAKLQVQSDGNLVLLHRIAGVWEAVWASHTTFPRTPPPPPPPPIGGDVFLQGRAFADDNGAFLALGSSYFSALHRERTDRPGLQANLQWLADRGVTYVRMLSMVGQLPFWAGRVIDPAWVDYFGTFDNLIADALAARVRLQVVVFADAQVMMPSQSDRLAWIDTMAAYLEAHRPVVQFIEIANESQLNGVTDADLAALTRRWEAISTIPVAPSSTTGSNNPEAALEFLYATQDLCADLLTPHFQRDNWEENYRHWRQPWEVHDYDGTCTTVYVNNEPLRDTQPSRYAIGLANTIISGGAGFNWHTDAGVRGRQDFADMPNSDAVLAALAFVRDLLPPTLPNGEYCNHHWDCHPYENLDQIWVDNSSGTGVVRAYSSRVGGRTYVALTGLKVQYQMAAKAAMSIDVFSLCTQQVVETLQLAAGAAYTFLPVAGCRDYIHRVTSP